MPKSLHIGAAYVYQYEIGAWSQKSKLVPAEGSSKDFFGHSVGIFKNTIAIGSSGDDYLGENSGTVYTFNLYGGSWSQNSKLIATDGSSQSYFGSTLSLQENSLVIGVFTDDTIAENTGILWSLTFYRP